MLAALPVASSGASTHARGLVCPHSFDCCRRWRCNGFRTPSERGVFFAMMLLQLLFYFWAHHAPVLVIHVTRRTPHLWVRVSLLLYVRVLCVCVCVCQVLVF